MEVKVSANISIESFREIAASSSMNSLPDGSFLEVNADLKSTSTQPTCELAASSLRTHCQAAAH